jgi:hypothetical protein
MKTQPPLVGTDGTVHFDPKSTIDMDLTLVVRPGHPKKDNPLRFDQSLQNFCAPIFRILVHHRLDGFNDFGNRLVELFLVRIFLFDPLDDGVHGFSSLFVWCIALIRRLLAT